MLHNIEWLLTIKDKLKLIFLNFSTSLVNIYFLTKLIISLVEGSYVITQPFPVDLKNNKFT